MSTPGDATPSGAKAVVRRGAVEGSGRASDIVEIRNDIPPNPKPWNEPKPKPSSGAFENDAHTVYLFDPISARPKFHEYGDTAKVDLARWADKTKCGLVMYDGEEHTTARIRADHAALFATPCRRCFPNAD